MIGKLKGTVDEIGPDWIILDVHGVGYQLHCPVRLLAALETGMAATLAVETVVREDQIRLYGFRDMGEREWFRLLQTVQGVGAKVALSVLGVLSAGELADAISYRDAALIARAPGVGKKVAERIIAELKDKSPMLAITPPGAALPPAAAAPAGAISDAVSALVNLGYGRAEAGAAVSGAARAAGEGAATEALIRLALKELAR